jgi:hypothetical protein
MSWAERICLAFVDTKRLFHFLIGVRPERGERHNRADFALPTRRLCDRARDWDEAAILNAHLPAGAMGVELALQAEAKGFGWCRLLTHWPSPR